MVAPILKERTEREGARRGRGAADKNTHTTRVSEERGRETEVRWGVGGREGLTCLS
jgi:hypothetical protein